MLLLYISFIIPYIHKLRTTNYCISVVYILFCPRIVGNILLVSFLLFLRDPVKLKYARIRTYVTFSYDVKNQTLPIYHCY